MDKIDFSFAGGFPLETDTLDFLQNSYIQLQELAKAIAGNFPCILSGCEVNGSVVSPGSVIINGEVLPFVGGSLNTYVNIFETVKEKEFKSGGFKPIYFSRQVQFSNSGILWSSMIRIEELVVNQNKIRKSITNLGRMNSVNDRDLLFGCTMTVAGNNYSHTSGAIYYNEEIYTVDALALTSFGGGKPKWGIDKSSKFENKLKLVSFSDSSGLFDFDSIFSSPFKGRRLEKYRENHDTSIFDKSNTVSSLDAENFDPIASNVGRYIVQRAGRFNINGSFFANKLGGGSHTIISLALRVNSFVIAKDRKLFNPGSDVGGLYLHASANYDCRPGDIISVQYSSPLSFRLFNVQLDLTGMPD
jgi:hypothetical protein